MLNMLENIVQSRTAAEVTVEIEGFEGEWFDPYDIEGYLESRGIHIDPTVSFVEAEIDYAFDTAAPNHQQHSPRSALLSTYSSSGGDGRQLPGKLGVGGARGFSLGSCMF